MVNLGPWANSDLWSGLGVDHAKAFQAHVDAVVLKLLAVEAEADRNAAYQDEMRRG